MVVSDLFKVMSETQQVDIYSLENGVFMFTGASRDITRSCMDSEVKNVFTNKDLLVIEVEQFDVEQ